MHASDKKQASPVAVRFAFLFATAAFLTGAVAQTGRDEVVPPGGENEPPVLLDIEPIPGLTTRRHRIVPEEPVPLPLGSRLVLRASPSTVHLLPASYRWLGARELEDGDGVSTACFRASSVGLHEVRVVPRILGAEPEPLQVRIRVLPVKASEIRVRVRKPDKLVTFIGDELSWQVETQPAEFARLVEWKAPTMRPAFGFGPVFRTRGSRPGRSHPITASIGPRASPTPVQPILYKVQWVSKPAKSDYFQSTPTIRLYHEIKTIPAGYEDLVPWTYDTIGTGIASATTGRGRSFTVVRSHFRWHRLLCWRVRAGNLEERRDFFNKVVESLFQKRANQPEKNRQEGREPDPCSSSVPITFSNGEATVTAVDLRVPSRGFDFVWQRTYSSRADFPGPGGHNWALNYNQRIATVPGAKSVSFIDGSLREDIFQFAKSLVWVSPPGYYDRLVRKIDLSYERIDRDGTTYRFDSNGWLVSITDRTGKNTLRIQRNSHSNIVEIVDTQDRVYTVSYTDNSATQKVAALTDFRGRTIRYTYDANGDLVRVRSPIVLNTPNGNDFPNGKTTLYSYSSGSTDSRLNHNLLSIVEPLYNVANDPRQSKPLATMTYATTTDPTAVDFDHVVAERWGHDQGGPPRNPGIKVGGTSTFAYSRDLKSDPLAPGTAVHKTIETTRNGNVRVHYFDVADREIRRIEQTNRNVRPGENDYITDYAFTNEGLLRQVIYPRLNVVMREYDLTNPRRQSQKNLLEVRRQVGRVGGGLVDLVTRYTYEPVFNRLRTVTDPRGFPKGTVPKTSTGHLDLRNPCVARYTTTRFFDYQEGTGFQAGRGIVAAERIPEGLGDLNGAPDFEAGNVVKIAHPKIQTPGPNLGQIIEEKFTWNQHAQMLTRKDPEDQVTKLDYFPSNTKPRDPSDLEGYLQARTEDANGFALKTILDYDIVGNITGITDPKGQRTDFVVNQLNQLVRTLSRPVKAAGFRYRVDRFYDANDNLVKTETQNLDEKGNAYAHNPIVKTRDYDILHNLVAVSDDKTRNDGTLAGQVTTEFFYDAHLNRTAVKYPKPLGTRVATIVTTQYDERELPYKVITGDNDTNPYNSPPATAVIATTNYDPNRNLLETIDTLPQTKRSQVKTKFPGSAPGDVTLFEYDGFDRLTKTTDGEANLHERA
ncbi:MAG: DUF6531 domain-containing protein, partial [Planctomycetota bacterium]